MGMNHVYAINNDTSLVVFMFMFMFMFFMFMFMLMLMSSAMTHPWWCCPSLKWKSRSMDLSTPLSSGPVSLTYVEKSNDLSLEITWEDLTKVVTANRVSYPPLMKISIDYKVSQGESCFSWLSFSLSKMLPSSWRKGWLESCLFYYFQSPSGPPNFQFDVCLCAFSLLCYKVTIPVTKLGCWNDVSSPLTTLLVVRWRKNTILPLLEQSPEAILPFFPCFLFANC